MNKPIMRREFPTRVRVAVIKRATKDGVIYCEKCHAMAKRFQVDHMRPDALLGAPVLENAMLICDLCFGIKNPEDTRRAAKAKRVEAKHIGAARTKPPISTRAKAERPPSGRIGLPPRVKDAYGRPC